MKVWLDDQRPLPIDRGFTVWVTNSKDCIDILSTNKVELISLDHDLSLDHYVSDWKLGIGPDGRATSSEDTGMEVVEYIVQKAQEGVLKRLKTIVHTANVVRGPIMEERLKQAEIAWDSWERTVAKKLCDLCGRSIPNEHWYLHQLVCPKRHEGVTE